MTYTCKATTQRSSLIPSWCSSPTPNPSPHPACLSPPPHIPSPGCHQIMSWCLTFPHSCCVSQLSAAALCKGVREICLQYRICHPPPHHFKPSVAPVALGTCMVYASWPLPCTMSHLSSIAPPPETAAPAPGHLVPSLHSEVFTCPSSPLPS